MPTPEQNLAALGITIPAPAKPLAAYVPAVRTGNIIFTAGQLPLVGGELLATGKVGHDITPEAGAELAKTACINALAAIKDLTGSLDKVKRVVRVVAYVACTSDFYAQPTVANGASEFLLKVFGDAGKHARSAVGMNVLPRNAPVEIELTVEVE